MGERLFQLIHRHLSVVLTVAAVSVVAGCAMVSGTAVRHSSAQATVPPKLATPAAIGGHVAADEDSASELPPSLSNDYGFSAGELVWLDDARRAQQLDNIKATGARWVRLDMQWYTVQPYGPDTYDWSAYDSTIDAITRHGLRALVILDYAPAWAAAAGCRPAPSHKCSPANPQDFAIYAAAATARYTTRGVTAWEIWNEPNAPKFWYPNVSPAKYAAVLKAAYGAIKKINPGATVIAAGLRSATGDGDVNPADYIAALYAAGAQPYFDALGAHPYSYPSLPSAAAGSNGWTQMLQIHDIAASYGDSNKKIWMTEVGATTGGPHPVSEARQAQIVEQVVQLRSSYPWAGPLFWYNYQDLGTNRAESINFFGLVRADGSHKSAYDSFVQAIQQYR